MTPPGKLQRWWLAGASFCSLCLPSVSVVEQAQEDLRSLNLDNECMAQDEMREGCAVSALQRRVRSSSLEAVNEEAPISEGLRLLEEEGSRAASATTGTAASSDAAALTSDSDAVAAARVGCHNCAPGESCYDELQWARNVGMKDHPDWYLPSGITPGTPDDVLQAFIHNSNPRGTPRPCTIPSPLPWCKHGAIAPALWKPSSGANLHIRILTYNLFWWNLFNLRHGNGNSAGRLIQDQNAIEEFDVMGFQECEDPGKVLDPVGLSGTFEGMLSGHAICMAYNKQKWQLLANGTDDVGEDMATKYYGRRGVQWMRLSSLEVPDRKLFFMNHHGPLSVNSGGVCGGQATAYNLLQVMARRAEVGDILVLVGDFNANAASLTVQTLWSHLVQAFAGTSFGGVDNIFTNIDSHNVVSTSILGSGGSDHDAISATLNVQPADTVQGAGATVKTKLPLVGTNAVSQPLLAAQELLGAARPGHIWQEFWCGAMEDSTEYVVDTSGWSLSLTGRSAVAPDDCCRECQMRNECKTFIWKDYSPAVQGKECVLSSSAILSKRAMDGFVSGMAYTAAAEVAIAKAATAKLSM
mmetsp:Transcript_30977/g.66636  ORF Transcript_30977/g.66636 Transcript_30977/m.66636 type:complete len:582 (+) Transcript_30977:178-1923(+)